MQVEIREIGTVGFSYEDDDGKSVTGSIQVIAEGITLDDAVTVVAMGLAASTDPVFKVDAGHVEKEATARNERVEIGQVKPGPIRKPKPPKEPKPDSPIPGLPIIVEPTPVVEVPVSIEPPADPGKPKGKN